MPRNTRTSQAAVGTDAFPLAVVSTSENSANDNSVPPVSSATKSSQLALIASGAGFVSSAGFSAVQASV